MGPPVVQALSASFRKPFSKHPISGSEIEKVLQFENLLDLMGKSSMNAICSADGRAPMSHLELFNFVQNFDLRPYGIYAGDRCALLLPNGPELSVAVLSVASRCCAFPVNPQNTHGEIQADMESVRAKAMIVQSGQHNEHLLDVAKAMSIPLIELTPSETRCGAFELRLHSSSPVSKVVEESETKLERTPRDGHALVLHTSGTSGKKKIVPYTLNTICVGAACVLMSWELTEQDVDLNMMPLFHIGGIARNLFAVVLSGSSVVCASGFDPSCFWDIVSTTGVTWYYAGPTMHQLICLEANARGPAETSAKSKIRLIANAAGALLPAVAEEMKEIFGATILPGYGMTECMPISAPPCDYKLDRPGTSGVAIGPELAIFDDEGQEVPPGTVGNIVVRGAPLFEGYEGDEAATRQSFFEDGWFNTGDLGYLDEDKYLYITGRSKEVINRGGEIISPFEVEEALLPHPRVQNVLCFAVPHETLEETIGIVVVPMPGEPRIDLTGLLSWSHDHLHISKWPVVLVYMDDIPKGKTNKAQRIRLAQRFGMTMFNDEMPQSERTFEAACPGTGLSLNDPIPCKPITFDMADVQNAIMNTKLAEACHVVSTKFRRHNDAVVAYVTPMSIDIDALRDLLRLDDYYMPAAIIPVPELPMKNGIVDVDSLPVPHVELGEDFVAPSNPIEEEIVALWQMVLDCSDPIGRNESFFDLGGTSLLAGQLAALLREKFKIVSSVAAIFDTKTVEAMATEVAKQIGESPDEERRPDGRGRGRNLSHVEEGNEGKKRNVKPRDPSRCINMFIQLLPCCFFYPLKSFTLWFFWVLHFVAFVNILADAGIWKSHFIAMLLSVMSVQFAAYVFLPWFGIAFKWIVIGKYKAGRYGLHGSYYLRWWLVDQVLRICGKGMFLYKPKYLIRYYRLLGADIGSRVKISSTCKLGEFDLIRIANGATLDCQVVCRAMCMDKGTMCLDKIYIGKNVSIAFKTAIAPGAKIGANTCLGPMSSSYEIEDAKPEYRNFNKGLRPGPPNYLRRLLGYPILLLTSVLSQVPVIVLFYSMTREMGEKDVRSFQDALIWFTAPERIFYFLVYRVLRGVFIPFFKVFCAWIVKWTIIGKFQEGSRTKDDHMVLFKVWLMGKVLPHKLFTQVATLLGKHYSMVSHLYRMFGAKIGQNIYWPGSQFDIVEFDLFEVGDNVVFGSRSIVMVRDCHEAKKVVLENGSNMTDRCCCLPGVVVKECAVLGSGTFGAKGHVFPRGSVNFGSKNGKALQLSGENLKVRPSVSAFGRAFFGGEATYWVWPETLVIAYNILWKIVTKTCHALPIVCTLYLSRLLQPELFSGATDASVLDLVQLVGIALASFFVIFPLSVLMWLSVDVTAKWIVLGRRKPGPYPWDKSDYCQRWQLYISLKDIGCSISWGGSGTYAQPVCFILSNG